jgi:ABC-2 type transport system permease protein
MRGILLLTRAEVSRLRRNRRYFLFTLALPVVLYLAIGKNSSQAYGVNFAAYYMVAMASYGAFSGALNNNVFLLGATYGKVSLPVWQWVVTGVIVWLGSMIFAALAVAIGYRFPPDTAQPVTITVYLLFSLLGGIWFPLSGTFQKIGQNTPTYEAIKISTDVISNASVPAGLVIGMFIWLVIFLGLATLSVRSMAEQV